MQKIREPSDVPRGLYDYTVKETQAHFAAHSFGLLVVKVRKHLTANQLTIPEGLSRIIEEDWCSRRKELCYDPDVVIFDPIQREDDDMLTKLVAATAIPMADALGAISKAFGISCAACQKRHRLIKEMKKRGFTETLRLLKETLHA